MIELIAAAARTGVIGAENKLLWRIPEVFAFFKKTTMGSPVVMGSRTWASIGRALPGRLNVIVSRRLQPADISAKNVVVVKSLNEALSLAQARSRTGRVFVIGGGEIYRRAIAIADRVWLTKVDHDFEGCFQIPDQISHLRLLDQIILMPVVERLHSQFFFFFCIQTADHLLNTIFLCDHSHIQKNPFR